MTLEEKAAAAKALGLSYGQYIAKYNLESTRARSEPVKAPAGAYKVCQICGKRLTGHRSKVCSIECEYEHRKRKRAAGEWLPRRRR